VSRALRRPGHSAGQALVELAIILPLLVFMAIAIFDFARAFTTAITIEAAAREAADYGGLYPWHWDSSDPDSITTTEQEMETRACTAASVLTDYVGDDPATSDPVTCSNPTVTYQLLNDTGYSNCFDVPANVAPCRVQVSVEHEFQIFLPLRLTFGDAELGLPSQVTITRESIFAVSKFELDEGLAP
jgi:Flp pilus assembly protein TadG